MKATGFLSVAAALVAASDAFSTAHAPFHPQQQLLPASTSALFSTSTEQPTVTAEEDSETTGKGLLKRDRYVATNRFAVRSGKEAKFEQRWATRKSRLAELDGFKYFHLMRRVQISDEAEGQQQPTLQYDGGDDKESRQGNYVSFTIWDKKSDFSAWRKGDAFKEAHGGTSIGAFLSTSE